MTQQDNLNQILHKYQRQGIQKGSVFLLVPKLLIQVVRDLIEYDIVILGITTWVYVTLNDGSQGIAQDLSNEFYVSKEVLNSENASQLSAEQCINYISQLTTKTDLASLELYSNLTQSSV